MLLETPKCNSGWSAPDFSLPDPDGAVHTLADAMGPNGLLVAFICNHCPYVKAIAARMAEDANALKEHGVHTVAIMSNDFANYPDDAPDKMTAFAERHGFGFPYLVDEDQSVAKAYGAVCTPDFFGFNGAGELQYRGRIDDKHKDSGEGRVPELLRAMRTVADTGIGPDEQFPSMGCSIKWKS
ncbi:MAG: thioredoxin family protein [Phycisphaerales bacterium JB040]